MVLNIPSTNGRSNAGHSPGEFFDSRGFRQERGGEISQPVSLRAFAVRRSNEKRPNFNPYARETMNTQNNPAPQPTGYLLLFRNTNWSDGIPEGEVRQVMDKIGAWFEQLAAKGKIVSAQPLLEESVVVPGKGGRTVTDGPFAEAKEVIGGYVLLSAESMAEAVEIAQSNPATEYGLTTEVRVTASACPHTYRVLRQLAENAA